MDAITNIMGVEYQWYGFDPAIFNTGRVNYTSLQALLDIGTIDLMVGATIPKYLVIVHMLDPLLTILSAFTSFMGAVNTNSSSAVLNVVQHCIFSALGMAFRIL